MAPATLQHLLNTSWTLHRLSPLHHEKEFATLSNPTALKTYASRLQDQLTGNTLGGLSSSTAGGPSGAVADDEALSRTGALKTCIWETLPSLALLEPQTQSRPSRRQPKQQPGILVTLEYENIVYKAALLAPPPPATATTRPPSPDRQGSTHLPLLLTRLPGPLRQTFVSFLAANFDTYCSALRFPSHFMCAGLEAYVSGMITGGDDRARQQTILEDVVKEMQITLAFSPSIAPELRSLNVNIPRGSFADFVGTDRADGSILSNLSSYLEKHLAMKLDLSAESDKKPSPAKEHVRVSRIACGGFLLGGDGRLKLVSLQKMIPGADDEENVVGSEGAGEVPGEKARLMLRANEALLLAVIRKVASVDEHGV